MSSRGYRNTRDWLGFLFEVYPLIELLLVVQQPKGSILDGNASVNQLVDGHLGEKGTLAGALPALLVHFDTLPNAVQDVASIEQAADLGLLPKARRMVLVEKVTQRADVRKDRLIVKVYGRIGAVGVLGRSLADTGEKMFKNILGLLLNALPPTRTRSNRFQPLGTGEAEAIVEISKWFDQPLLGSLMLPEYDRVEGKSTAHHATMFAGWRIGVGLAIDQILGRVLPRTAGSVDGLDARPEQSRLEATAQRVDEGNHNGPALLVTGAGFRVVLEPPGILRIVIAQTEEVGFLQLGKSGEEGGDAAGGVGVDSVQIAVAGVALDDAKHVDHRHVGEAVGRTKVHFRWLHDAQAGDSGRHLSDEGLADEAGIEHLLVEEELHAEGPHFGRETTNVGSQWRALSVGAVLVGVGCPFLLAVAVVSVGIFHDLRHLSSLGGRADIIHGVLVDLFAAGLHGVYSYSGWAFSFASPKISDE